MDDWTFVFGGSSDPQCGSGAGSPRLTATQQRGAGLAYNAAFFRTYLGGEPDFLPMLTDNNPPPSALTDEIFIAYHAPDSPALRRDVNRLATSGDLSINELGGSVTQTGMTPHDLCGGEAPQVFHCLPLASTSQQSHTAPSARSSKRGLGQLRSGWDSLAALFQNDLPAGFRDISGFETLSFRAAVNFDDARNCNYNTGCVDQNLSIILGDGTGGTASVTVTDHSNALFFPPGDTGPIPKVVLNTVRIPMSAFIGVDLTDVRTIQFRFDKRPSGALLISDIVFQSDPVLGP